MDKKEIWKRLGKVVSEDNIISNDQHELVEAIVDNLLKYQKLLEDISSNGVDDSKSVLIGLKRKEAVERIKLVALTDGKVTEEEKKLVNASIQIIKDLEIDLKQKLKKTA